MTLYTCEFYRFIHVVTHQHEFCISTQKVQHLYEIVFELLPLEQSKKTLNQHEHPIRVHFINGERIINGEGEAVISKMDHMGFVIFNIRLDGINYIAREDTKYLFPSYPQKLVDGSLRVILANYSDSRSRVGYVENPTVSDVAFLVPLDALSLNALSLNALPFMDASGTFVYQYKMVSKIVAITLNNGSYTEEIVELNTPVTLYQTDNKFTVMVDNATRKAYPIQSVVTVYQMPVYTEILMK